MKVAKNWRLSVAAPIVVLAGIYGWAELMHWQASWRRLGTAKASGGAEAVVVLGHKNRGTRANFMNRHRVRAGLRSQDPSASMSTLVLCGGTVLGEISEADLMARYARDKRGYAGTILLDHTSSTTWENIQNAIPLIEDADTIKIVSNSMHAEKGRGFLRLERPDLADRLVRAEDYRFGEIILRKPLLVLLGLKGLRDLRV